MVGLIALLALFSGRDSWNSKIIGVMAWKWCKATWLYWIFFEVVICETSKNRRDGLKVVDGVMTCRPFVLYMNPEFHLSFMWCMKGEKVKKRIMNKSQCAAICLKVSFREAKKIWYYPYIVIDRPPYNVQVQ